MVRASKKGFTIVELLIVIVVIAILAAITIVSFNGIQQRARVTAAKNDLSAIAKQLELYKVDALAYPVATDLTTWARLLKTAVGDLSDASVKSFVLCRKDTGSDYIVIAWSPIVKSSSGDIIYYVRGGSTVIQQAIYDGMDQTTVSGSACVDVFGAGNGAGWSHTWSHQL